MASLLGGETSDGVEGAARVAHEQVPEGDAELPRHCDAGFVPAAAGGDGQAPLLQGVVDLEEFLGGLEKEGADRAFPMAL